MDTQDIMRGLLRLAKVMVKKSLERDRRSKQYARQYQDCFGRGASHGS